MSDIQTFIEELAGFSKTASDDGILTLDIVDAGIVHLQYDERTGMMTLCAEIVVLDDEDLATVAPRLLAGNLFGVETVGRHLGVDPQSNIVILSDTIVLTEHSAFQARSGLGEFVSSVQYWSSVVTRTLEQDRGDPNATPAQKATLDLGAHIV